MRLILTADVVYTGVGLPIEDGAVLLSNEELEMASVVAVDQRARLVATYPDLPVRRIGRVVSPPPVNAHTHLDLSLFPVQRAPYSAWIPWLVEHQRANPSLRGLEAVRQGLDCLRVGDTGAVGDLVTVPEVMEVLLEDGLPGVAYWEVISLDPTQADRVFEETRAQLRRWRKLERKGGPRVGLSPHTPFTVSGALLRRLAEFARDEGIPLQIHVAESAAELELFRSGEGALQQALARLGSPDPETVFGRSPDPSFTPVLHLAELGMLKAQPSLVHMIHVSDEDIKLVADAGCVVVSCPRSNRNLDCGIFPWASYARQGVEIALGTDSVASGETLDIRDEVQAAAELLAPRVSQRTLVRSVVKGGYRALGLTPPVIRRGDPWSRFVVWA